MPTWILLQSNSPSSAWSIEAFSNAGEEAELHLTEGIGQCLKVLKDAGLKLGIICDVGMTPSASLRTHLIRHGVLPLFDHWSFSDEVGAYKPSPVIFELALRTLGCAPGDVLHVAQGFEYDIVPTHGLGWARVWINRYGKVGDPAYGPYHELPDLSGVPDLLGL